MYCNNCGVEALEEDKFCTTCGVNLKIVHSSKEKVFDCEKIEITGKPAVFKNNNGNVVMKTEHDGGNNWKIIKGNDIYLYLKFRLDGASYVYDVYDNQENKIGNVNLNSLTEISLRYKEKTLINIEDINGNQYVLEEDISKIKAELKYFLPKHYGVGAFLSARTGDMEIKMNNCILGRVKSKRGVLTNIYSIDGISNIESRMDARLIAAALAFKSVKKQ